MKKPGRGTNGHIAIGCNNVDRAIYHLSQRCLLYTSRWV